MSFGKPQTPLTPEQQRQSSSNIPETQKTFVKAMGVQQKYDALYGQKAGQRKIIKAADGYNYYADTGKRVLPSVEKEPSVDSQTTEFKNYLNTLEEGETATGAGFLAYQDRNIKKDKMSYNMKQDVNSYWRYTEGPMKGQRVFPDVSKEKEEKEKEPFNFGDEDKLRDDFRSESKEFVKVRDAYGRILSTDASAAGDLALIFNYMKILDPGSVVREGEFATAQNSAGIPERIRAQKWRKINRNNKSRFFTTSQESL